VRVRAAGHPATSPGRREHRAPVDTQLWRRRAAVHHVLAPVARGPGGRRAADRRRDARLEIPLGRTACRARHVRGLLLHVLDRGAGARVYGPRLSRAPQPQRQRPQHRGPRQRRCLGAATAAERCGGRGRLSERLRVRQGGRGRPGGQLQLVHVHGRAGQETRAGRQETGAGRCVVIAVRVGPPRILGRRRAQHTRTVRGPGSRSGEKSHAGQSLHFIRYYNFKLNIYYIMIL